jgi:hypothetical protein
MPFLILSSFDSGGLPSAQTMVQIPLGALLYTVLARTSQLNGPDDLGNHHFVFNLGKSTRDAEITHKDNCLFDGRS